MGYAYIGDALLKASFEVKVPQPLDNRTVVNSEQDLYNIPESSAYRGMTVANPDDGNIYMLTDTKQISSPLGWKASGISIITCTQDEYNKLLGNTNLEDYSPKGEGDFLRKDVYYYIPEEGDGTYLTSEWGKQIQEQLTSKADISYINDVSEDLTQLSQKLAQEYSTTIDIQNNYATLELTYSVEQADEKFLTKENASTIYTTQESFNALQTTLINDYVTKEDLRGSETEGDDFIFVTQNKYNTDRNADAISFQTELLTTTSTKTQDLSIQKIEEKEVVQDEEIIIKKEIISNTILSTNNNKLLSNGKQVALSEDVPKIEILSQEDYNNIPKKEIDPDKYYYTYDSTGDINNGYVTKEYIDNVAITRENLLEVLEGIVMPLRRRIDFLERVIAGKDSAELDNGYLDIMKLE